MMLQSNTTWHESINKKDCDNNQQISHIGIIGQIIIRSRLLYWPEFLAY